MTIKRPWAFWRRAQYITGVLVVVILSSFILYFSYFYKSASCFDNFQNGNENGIDCGGGCTRICALDVLPIKIQWSRSFRITDGQYNAVAYIENRNLNVGTPEMRYTFSLYDAEGLIVERSGVSVVPPDSVYPIFEGRINTGNRVPTRTSIVLEEPDNWLPASAGREQFIVESRELTGADQNPRLDATLTNTDLAEARDVEIVATIFDSKRNALTSSRTVVPNFSGRSTKDVVFTWPEPIAKTLRSCEVPTDVVLAIDLSGSMNDDGGNPPEPITSVLNAADAFIERLNTNDQVGVVTYATGAELSEKLTLNKNEVRGIVKNLFITPESETGSTNTGDAIKLAALEIGSSRHNFDARKVLVLLTDGLANEPEEDPEEYAQILAEALKQTDTEIFTIGLGDTVNEKFLQNIASSKSHYFRAASSATVDRIYQSITAAICEDGAAVIEIIPKTTASFQSL